MFEKFAFSIAEESALVKGFCTGVAEEEKFGSEDGSFGDMFHEFSKCGCMTTEQDFCWCYI